MLVAYGLQLCNRTHLKKGLVPHSYAGGVYDKYWLAFYGKPLKDESYISWLHLSYLPGCQHQLWPQYAPAIRHPVHVQLAVRTALALQHLAHVQLTLQASNHIFTPPVNPIFFKNRDINLPTLANISYLHRMSRYTSTTRPTSPTHIEHRATPLQLDQHHLPTSNI